MLHQQIEKAKKELLELLNKQGLSPQDPEDEAAQQIYAEQSAFLEKTMKSLAEDMGREIDIVYERLAKEQIELFGGKLPFTFLGKEIDERLKIQIYSQGLLDFKKHLKHNLNIKKYLGGEE